MGRKAIDLTGRKYERLVAIRQVKNEKDGHHAFWECQCDCGNKIVVRKDSLESGHAKSCGCLLKERGLQRHGYSYTNIYGILQGMKDRCYNKNSHAYHLYGGRGIKVCYEQLKSAEAFIKWSYENGYVDGKPRNEQSIDRIDVNGNYCPDNCRWVSQSVQTQNRRPRKSTVLLSYGGQSLTAKEWSDKLNVSVSVIRNNFLHTGTPYNKHQLCNTREGLQHQRSPGV